MTTVRRVRVGGSILVLAAILAGAAWPAAADAYRLSGQTWPKRTITYRDGGPNRAAVRMAVSAWNASGARIRFKAERRGRADVVVRRLGGGIGFCNGFAQLGYSRHTQATVDLAKCKDRSIAALVAAHEFGHILGIDHEPRRCATMNATVTGDCKQPKPFMARCRLLQRDDVRAAIRRYGGRAKRLRADFCPRFAAPSAPVGVSITGAADVDAYAITASFTLPRPRMLIPGSGPAPRGVVAVYRYAGACPGGPPTGKPLTEMTVDAGRNQLDIDERPDAGPGRHCYAFWVKDAVGRRAVRAATATVDVRVLPPRAVLEPMSPAFVGEEVYFGHASEEGEAGIAAEHWTFGDGASSSENIHTYSQAGTYPVTLTVTDRFGQASTATGSITVTAAE